MRIIQHRFHIGFFFLFLRNKLSSAFIVVCAASTPEVIAVRGGVVTGEVFQGDCSFSRLRMRSYAPLSPKAEFWKRFGRYNSACKSVDVVVSNTSIAVFKVTIRWCGSDLRILRMKNASSLRCRCCWSGLLPYLSQLRPSSPFLAVTRLFRSWRRQMRKSTRRYQSQRSSRKKLVLRSSDVTNPS